MKKALSILIVICIFFGIIINCDFAINESIAASNYNASAAVDYANSHWDDGVGLCAEFVSKCLNAGGINIPNKASYYSSSKQSYNNNSGTLGSYTNPYTCSASQLVYLAECGYQVITNPSNSDFSVGDIAFMYTMSNGVLTWKDGHVGIIVKITNGKPYYAAHNRAQSAGSFSSSYPCTYLVKMNGTVQSHTRNTNYGTNFTAYLKDPNSNHYVYNEYHNNTGGWVNAADPCTIIEVYTDGCCKFSYILDSGKTNTAYGKIDWFYWPDDSCTGYNIAINATSSLNSLFDSDLVTITVTPHVNDRDAYDEEIQSISLHILRPDGKVITTNIEKTRTIYLGQAQPQGEYTFYATVSTVYGHYDGSPTNGSVKCTLTRPDLGYKEFVTNDIIYRRIKFTDLNTYVTVESDGNIASYSRQINSGSTQSQVWMLIKNPDSSYTIKSLHNDKVIDVAKGNYSCGKNILSYTSQDSDNQKWELCTYNSTQYYLKAIKSDSAVLDVNGGNGSDGTNIQLWRINGSAAQKLEFVYPYEITFNANGGEGAPSVQRKDYNKAISLSNIKPTRKNYTFCGWAKSSAATNAVYSAGGSYSDNADVTLYAVWKPCSHSWGSGQTTTAATCTGTGIKTFTCTICNATKTETIPALGHNWDSSIKLNDTQHKSICSRDSSHTKINEHVWGIGRTTTAATCTATGIKTFTCIDCYATRTETISALGHSWGSWTKLNDSQHQRVCSRDSSHKETQNHTWDSGKVTSAATCTGSGIKTYNCTTCKATKTEAIPALGHSWGVWKKLNDTQHQRVCTRCNSFKDTQNHTWNDGVVTAAATCINSGKTTYTCTTCKAYANDCIFSTTKTEAIPALGHSWGSWTKLNDSQHQRVCSRDSSHKETQNHTWDSGKVTSAATCTGSGIKTYTCTACNATKTETSPVVGHDWGVWTKLNETQHQRICNRDSSHKETNNHSWDSGKVTSAATCTGSGIRTYACTICNATKTETIPALGHDYSTSVKVNDTQHKSICSRDSSHVLINNHVWGIGRTTTAATCTTTGIKTFTCIDCYTTRTETIAALEHNWGSWTKLSDTQHQRVCSRDSSHKETQNHAWDNGKVTSAVTCTDKGSKTYSCTVCKAAKTEIIPAAGHAWSAWKTVKEATEEAEGEASRSCSACGKTEIKYLPKIIHYDGTNETTGFNLRKISCENGVLQVAIYLKNCKNLSGGKLELQFDPSVLNIVPSKKTGTDVFCLDRNRENEGEKPISLSTEANVSTWNDKMVYAFYFMEGSCETDEQFELLLLTFEVKDSNAETAEFTLNQNYSIGKEKTEKTEKSKSISLPLNKKTDNPPETECTHVWDEGKVTVPATPTAQGEMTYICTICGATKTEPISVPSYLAGDINGDGKTNNKDLTRLMKYLAGEDVTVVVDALDVNGDKKINNKDLTRLMKYLAGEEVTIY